MGPFIDLEAKRRVEKMEGAAGAGLVGYTPADGADWPAPPATVGGALDALAERAGALEDVAERFAARYIVGPAGQTGVTHNTVQAAITAAEAGARPALVYVRAGSYAEDIALGADGVHLVGEAAFEGVTIIGAHTIDIGDQPADDSTSHQAELRSVLLVAPDPAVAAVLTISGNPQRVWLRDVRIWGGASAVDCLVVNCADGQVALRDCHVWHSVGGAGTPIVVQAGTLRLDGGCAVDHGSEGYAIDNTAGIVWGPGSDLRVTGRVRNLAPNGAGGFAVFLSGVAITTGDTSAFVCDGAGVVQLGLVGSVCAGTQPVATGAGGFAWTSDQAVLIGHTAPAVTLNGGAGAADLRSVGASSILATLATYGDLVTVNRADLREVSAGGTSGQVLTKGAGAVYDWQDAAVGGGVSPIDGQSIYLDGSSRLELPDAAFTGDFTAAFSVEVWAWFSAEDLDQCILGQWLPGTTAQQSVVFRADVSAGRLELLTTSGVTQYTFSAAGLPIAVGRWVKLGLTFDPAGATASFYVNGVLMGTDTQAPAAPNDSTQPVVIGQRTDTTQPLSGWLRELRMWSGVRTEAQMAANMGAPIDAAAAGLVFVLRFDGDLLDATGNGNNFALATGTEKYTAFRPPMNAA